ncbi:MAG: phosphodiester glycosidase family protein, partial [Acidimicrobiales bacterium]
ATATVPTTAPAGGTGTGTTATTAAPGPPHLPPPAPIPPIASPALPGEGQWHPIGRKVHGLTAMYAARVRPDTVHTSLVTAVAWMDPKLLSAKLFAGAKQPGGGPWPNMAPIAAGLRPSLVAAFNSGFKMSDAHGGYYSDGRTAVPLVNGAASFVIYKNGTATVANWGRDATMGTNIASVRQNLTLIVDHGKPVGGLGSGSYRQWGATVGNKVLVWRSGIGVTKNGALVYAAGKGLSVSSLANVLAHAGAVRAMELDINSDWTNFFIFNPAPGQPALPSNGTRLLPDMVRPPQRYFEATARDFIAMFAR